MLITKEINDYIDSLVKQTILSYETANYLKTKHPRTPIFYMLPKIHKQNNPGRPIVSQTNSPTERISQFVDSIIKPLAVSTKSYIKDTNDFINKLRNLGNIPEDTVLVTIDVCALYTNIPHKDGLKATKKVLDRRESKEIPTDVVLRLLEFVLKRAFFRFNKQHYEQKHGTTMETTAAPNYSIITVDDIETSFLETQTLLPLIWWRYIDDIFALWCWGIEKLKTFIQALNEFHPTLKFTSEYSEVSINFLDVTIIKEGTSLYTTLYNKPTNAFNYLDYRSSHHNKQKDNIPYAQALRIRKICTRISDFEKNADKLLRNLLRRHYPKALIENSIQKARDTDRDGLLQHSQKNKEQVIPLCITFHPNLKIVPKILRQNLVLLTESPTTEHFKARRIITAFRKGKNLRQMLVKSDIKVTPKKEIGSFPCGEKCKLCKYIQKTNKVHSKDGSYLFKIKTHLNCKSISVIYLISCLNCGIQYIGQTGNSLRERMYGHFNDVTNENPYKPVSAHF